MKIRKASPDISAKGALALLRVQKKYADLCLDTSYHYYGKPVEIISAEHRPAIWYGENTEAYLIEVRTGGLRNKFATIAVKVGE